MKTSHDFKSAFKEMFADAPKTGDYYTELLKLGVTEEIYQLMTEQSITKSDLAGKMGCSPAYITKVLNGTANLTLYSLAHIVYNLNAKWCCKAVPLDVEVDFEWHPKDKGASFRDAGNYKILHFPDNPAPSLERIASNS